MSGVRLAGRGREQAAITALINNAAVTGGALVLTGEPGIGKSALLQVAEDVARAAGVRVLTMAGVESEAQLPFAGLHLLLRRVLSSARGLPPAQRDALRSAFGLFDGPPPEPFLVALATGNLLAQLSTERPVAVFADDVQWLDPQTQEAVTFVARRAGAHRIAVIGAVRTGHSGPFVSAGLPELEVAAVDETAATQILRSAAGDLTAADRDRIRMQARGNPLALLELPATWRGPLAPTNDLQPVTLSVRLERAFAARIAQLPESTRDALLVAAVDSAGDVAQVLAAAAVLRSAPTTPAALLSAVDARMIILDGASVVFRHPLVRSAVLQAETLTRRQAANAAMAAVLVGEPYRRTWHRAQSIIGPDDDIADDLEANVRLALSRGGVMSAIRDLERSAQLTRESSRRGRRLLLAAEHAFSIGRADLVDRLVTAAARTDLSELDVSRMAWLREIFHDGVPGDATRVLDLCQAAEKSAGMGDRDLALNLLLGAALRCWWADTGPAARARVVAIAQRLAGTEDDPRLLAALAVAEPVLQVRVVLDRLRCVAVDEIGSADTLRLLGMAAHAVGDEVRAADLLSRAERMLRDQGRLGLLPQVLSMQVQVRLELGDWDGAAAAADEGQRLARDTGQPIWTTGTLVCDARANAFRGHPDVALKLATQAELAAGPRRLNDLLACVQLARGAAWFVEGRYPAAYAALRRLFDPADASFHQRERFAGVMFLAEAAIPAGQVDDARRVVEQLQELAAVAPAPILRVHLLYARAVLAHDRDADRWYRDALREDLGAWPWPRARLELAYGTWLRRRGRPGEARAHLASAAAVLTRIGAAAWAERARAELQAAGDSPQPR